MAGALQAVRAPLRGHVEERAGHAGDAQAVVLFEDVELGIERAAAVGTDGLRRVARAEREQVNPLSRSLAQSPLRGGGEVADDSVLEATARQNGRPQPAARRQQRMPHRPHAAVDRMQSPASGAVLDRPIAKPRRSQLRRRDGATLPFGERRRATVATVVQNGLTVRRFCTHVADGGPRGRSRAGVSGGCGEVVAEASRSVGAACERVLCSVRARGAGAVDRVVGAAARLAPRLVGAHRFVLGGAPRGVQCVAAALQRRGEDDHAAVEQRAEEVVQAPGVIAAPATTAGAPGGGPGDESGGTPRTSAPRGCRCARRSSGLACALSPFASAGVTGLTRRPLYRMRRRRTQLRARSACGRRCRPRRPRGPRRPWSSGR